MACVSRGTGGVQDPDQYPDQGALHDGEAAGPAHRRFQRDALPSRLLVAAIAVEPRPARWIRLAEEAWIARSGPQGVKPGLALRPLSISEMAEGSPLASPIASIFAPSVAPPIRWAPVAESRAGAIAHALGVGVPVSGKRSDQGDTLRDGACDCSGNRPRRCSAWIRLHRLNGRSDARLYIVEAMPDLG